MSPGDAAIIFTPDDTHFAIASACVRAGLHTLVAKPLVRTLEHHRQLVEEAEAAGVMVGGGQGGQGWGERREEQRRAGRQRQGREKRLLGMAAASTAACSGSNISPRLGGQ
jgi:hypothetical protein